MATTRQEGPGESTSQKATWPTTRHKITGGLAVGALALAFYFGTQFKGPGLGGGGAGDGPGEGVVVSTDPGGTPTTGDPITTPTVTDLVGDGAGHGSSTSANKSDPLIAVVITGEGYLLSPTGDAAAATPAALADIGRAALSAQGDGQGIRVRIFRKRDATAGARLDLFTKLTDAGISSEAIQEMREFIN